METELLTAQELAQKLKVSMPAVRRWTLTGMPHKKIGGRLVRFELEKALSWLEQRGREEVEAARCDASKNSQAA